MMLVVERLYSNDDEHRFSLKKLSRNREMDKTIRDRHDYNSSDRDFNRRDGNGLLTGSVYTDNSYSVY